MATSPFFIYPIEEKHLELLVDIAIRTFDETFAETNTSEDMLDYNQRCFTIPKFKEELKVTDSAFFFIDFKGELAGYLKVNVGEAQTELREQDGFELERIYVLRKFHGSGVGQALMDHAIRIGREKGKKYLWLGVWEYNFRAQKFYAKYGMEVFDEHIFLMGKTPQRDVLMRMEL